MNIKVKLSTWLIKHHPMNAYRRVEAQLYAVCTSTLDDSEWSASSSGGITPTPARSSRYASGRRLSETQGQCEGDDEKKNLFLSRGSNPDFIDCSIVTIITDISVCDSSV